MKQVTTLLSLTIAATLILSGCSLFPSKDTDSTLSKKSNPASENCIDRGGELEVRKNSTGGKFSVCMFDDGSECEEWAFFHGLCKPGEQSGVTDSSDVTTSDERDTSEDMEDHTSASEDGEKQKEEEEGDMDLGDNDVGLDTTTSENIIVEYPTPGTQLSSPFEVTGSARVFENVVHVDITTTGGTSLIQQTTTAKSSDTGQFGDFKQKIFYEFSSTKEGYLEVYSTSARDGSKINVVRIPVTF